jgi:LPS-assembly protein
MKTRPVLSSLASILLAGSFALTAAQAATAPSTPAGTPATTASSTSDDQILLQAHEVIYDNENKTVAAVGDVEISKGGRTLMADRLEYDQKSGKVTASGHVALMDQNGNVAFADHVVLSDDMRNGALSGFGALIGKNGRLAAQSARRINGDTVIANHTVYSPCKICNKPGQRTPLWQVKAERVIYNRAEHRVHFKNATLDLMGVPILYTPVLSVPDPSVHYASGLLAPELGNSTRIGYFLRTPVYFALSPSNDLTLAPTFSTSGGDVLEAEYRMRWNEGGMWLQGSGAYNPDGALSGNPGAQTYGHLFGSGRLKLSQDWHAGFDLQTTSNNGYMRFYDISYLDRLVSDLFIAATPGRSRFAMTGYYFESLRSTDLASTIPYILPQINLSLIPIRKTAGGRLRMDISSRVLGRTTGYDSQRLSLEMNWRRPFVFADGQLWTFVLDGRGDGYHLQTPPITGATAQSQFVDRGTGYAALDWRWPFIADGGGGRSYILQPIAQLIAQPYGGNPIALRNEDSTDFEFTESNIFSFNRLPGYDLIESGPRANAGFMAQAIFPGGEVQAVVGQTYRLKPDPIFSALSGNTGTTSDIVGRFSVKFPHLDITDRIDVDRSDGTVRRHEVYVTGSYARSSLQVSYVQLPPQVITLGLPSREEINAQADLNIWGNWQLFAAAQRDLESSEFLNTEYGIGYEDECLAVSLAYRRKFTRDAILGLPPSTSIVLHFNLKTGDSPVRPFSLFPRNVFALSHP